LSDVRNEVKRPLILHSVFQDLFSQEVLHLGVMAFTKQLDESEHPHAPDDALSFALVDQEHFVHILIFFTFAFFGTFHALIYSEEVFVFFRFFTMLMIMFPAFGYFFVKLTLSLLTLV
jgi:hypothetical protein